MRLCPSGERRNEQVPAETNKAFALKPEFQMVWGAPPPRVPIEYRFHCLTQGDFPTLMFVQERRVMGYPPPGPSEFNDRRAAVLTFTEARLPATSEHPPC